MTEDQKVQEPAETTEIVVKKPELIEQMMPEAPAHIVMTMTPAQTQANQNQVIAWCRERIAALQVEQREHQENYEHALKAKWRSAPFKRMAAKVGKQLRYYETLEVALCAGYVIVPNMPLNIFAVRVKDGRKKPVGGWQKGWYWNPGRAQLPALLPAGEGQMVSDEPLMASKKVPAPTERNQDAKDIYWTPSEDAQPEFPIRGVHPHVLEATAGAAAKLIFDEIGVVADQPACGDPIVCGRIIDRSSRHRVTLFIAWWLRKEDL